MCSSDLYAKDSFYVEDIAVYSLKDATDEIIVPEEGFKIEEVVESIKSGYAKGKKHNIIVLAEGVMSADEFAEKLKEAGDMSDLRVTELGHIQRGGSPTARDRVLASRMGAHAVKLLKKGIGGVASSPCTWTASATCWSPASRSWPVPSKASLA